VIKRRPTEFNTFSIAARCQRTGMYGVAVSTAALAVGGFVPFACCGVGAIATQCCTNPYFGVRGLKMLAEGLSASEVLANLVQDDKGRDFRQVSVVDARGQAVSFTGAKATPWAGHCVGDGYAVAGNTLVGGETIRSMARAFEESAEESLPERLVRALEAGQAAGGDKRGKQSAALYVVHTEDYGWVDLRVDDHADPVAELRRLWNLHRETLLPFMEMFPTKADPVGVLEDEEWERIEREIAEKKKCCP